MQTAVDFVKKDSSPGVETKPLPDGKVSMYEESTNTFAIKDKHGKPVTLRRPENGREFYDNSDVNAKPKKDKNENLDSSTPIEGKWTTGKNKESGHSNLKYHYGKHGAEFPEYKNITEYEKGANDFIKKGPSSDVRVKETSDGSKYIYEESTQTLAIARGGVPATYYRNKDAHKAFDKAKGDEIMPDGNGAGKKRPASEEGELPPATKPKLEPNAA